MNNSDKPAMPPHASSVLDTYMGLSKREHFAAMAMQGMMANVDATATLTLNGLAGEAVANADALLKALEK